ncbi:hypothetical protein quinque_000621 [Culex quinquefasciatus]
MRFVALLVASLLAAVEVYGSFQVYQKAARECVSALRIPKTRLASYHRFSFPPDRETMGFVRCVTLVLNLWEDCTGINWHTIGSSVDEPRSREVCHCIASQIAIIDPSDVCAQAYYSLRCFRRNVPTILSDAVVSADYSIEPSTPNTTTPVNPFVPLTAVQIAKEFTTCLAECGIRCALYCTLVRTGVFSDQGEALLDNLYAQLARCETPDSFRFRMELCFQRREQPPGTCPQEVIYRQYLPCLLPEYLRFLASHRAELEPQYGSLCVRD